MCQERQLAWDIGRKNIVYFTLVTDIRDILYICFWYFYRQVKWQGLSYFKQLWVYTVTSSNQNNSEFWYPLRWGTNEGDFCLQNLTYVMPIYTGRQFHMLFSYCLKYMHGSSFYFKNQDDQEEKENS